MAGDTAGDARYEPIRHELTPGICLLTCAVMAHVLKDEPRSRHTRRYLEKINLE